MTLSDSPADSLVLTLDTGLPGTNTIKLRVSRRHARELSKLMDEQGLEHELNAEFAQGTQLTVYAVILGAGPTLQGIATVLEAIFHRHDNKAFSASAAGQKLDSKGSSERELRKVVTDVLEAQRELDERWDKSHARDDPPGQDQDTARE